MCLGICEKLELLLQLGWGNWVIFDSLISLILLNHAFIWSVSHLAIDAAMDGFIHWN